MLQCAFDRRSCVFVEKFGVESEKKVASSALQRCCLEINLIAFDKITLELKRSVPTFLITVNESVNE